MTTTPQTPGWYADPDDSHHQRWWDGQRWIPRGFRRPLTPSGDAAYKARIGTFSGAGIARALKAELDTLAGHAATAEYDLGHERGKTARLEHELAAEQQHTTQLQADLAVVRSHNTELQSYLDQHPLSDLVKLEADIRETDNTYTAKRAQLAKIENEIDAAHTLLADINQQIVAAHDQNELQNAGLFDFEHAAEASVELASELARVRAAIKDAVRTKNAIHTTSTFTFNESRAEGKKFVDDIARVALRSFNVEAESAIKSVRAGSLSTAHDRLIKAAEQAERGGRLVNLQITPSYRSLREQELTLAYKHLVAVAAERELERERKAELREQKRVEDELRRAQEALLKEQAHYQNVLAELQSRGDNSGAERIREQLEEVTKSLDDVSYRQAHIRAGYVYVISNIGAFGPDVVKIGMTRRLDPLDRVRELGDASVPFKFDVHALFFSQDAVTIETKLHQRFEQQRLNWINSRREFFSVTPQEVLDALNEERVELVEYTLEPEALEYRESIAAREAPAA